MCHALHARLSVILLAAASVWAQPSAPPKIGSITGPESQNLSPGGVAFIHGIGFGSQAQVTINGSAVFLYNSLDTLVIIQIPASQQTGCRVDSSCQANLIVIGPGGQSAPFTISIFPVAPGIPSNLFGVGAFESPRGTVIGPGNPVSPGDRVNFYADGLGPLLPPPPPLLLVDGISTPIVSIGIAQVAFGGKPANVAIITFTVPPLLSGNHNVSITAFNSGMSGPGMTSNTVTLRVLSTGIVLSQTGLTFNAVEGGPSPSPQSFSVLSGVNAINFTISPTTFSGGSWLSATPQSGTAQFGQAGISINVQANSAGLRAGAYYGQIEIASTDPKSSPQFLTIVLKIFPGNTVLAPTISATGLVFTGVIGLADPPAQKLVLTNPSAATLTFTRTISPANSQFLAAIPGGATGTIGSGQSVTLSVQASLAGTVAGSYTATLGLMFSDGSARNVTLLLIVAPTGSGTSATALGSSPQASGCPVTKLVVIPTLLGNNFNVAAAWPTPLEVTVSDNCGTPMVAGTVRVTFSNGDPPLLLISQRNGKWSATWPPGNPRSSSIVISTTALQQETGLTATASITGGVQPNPSVPAIGHSGVVEAASYSGGPAPGNLISIFGTNLSDGIMGAPSLPLGTLLLTTGASMAGQVLPLVFTSDGQVNAMLPYSLPTDTRQQLIIQRAGAYSLPESVAIGVTRPAVFTVDSSGKGQGHIYRMDAAGKPILADATSPGRAGDVLVIYCAGLGAVDPPVDAGTPAPFTPPAKTATPVTASIGGRTASVQFAGLSPGFTGLYQVNVQIPSGLPDNSQTIVILSVAGEASGPVTFAVRNSPN